jgi:uncharacterized protein YjiS (DUF1127 family)
MTARFPAIPIATAPIVSGLTAVFALAARWGKAVMRTFKHRRDTAVLAGMDDYMLADIGLTRSDLRDAVSAHPWSDPTVLLKQRATERRLARHLQAIEPDAFGSKPTLVPSAEFQAPPLNRPARFSV